MRFPLEVAEAVRAVWPKELPLFVRISSVDGLDGGWELEDSVALAHELKARAVGVIDCSSCGNTPQGANNAHIPRGPGCKGPFSETHKRAVRSEDARIGKRRVSTR